MINPTNYSKAAMKAMLNHLPSGTMQEIAYKLNVSYYKVTNVCYGKQYDKKIVAEVEKRFEAAKKELLK